MDPLRSQPPRGLIVDFPTLVDQRGRIDRTALSRLLKGLEGRADGLLLGGPDTGPGPGLPVETRAELLELVAERTDLPLLAFITLPTKEESAECAEALVRIHPELVLVDAPLLARSNREVLNWLDYLGQGLERPILLHNHPLLVGQGAPQTKRRNIRTAILKRAAAENPYLAGLIFRGGFKRLLNYHRAVRSRPGFPIYDAQELRFLERPSTAGVVSPGAVLMPRVWAGVVGAALDRGGAEPLARTLACGRAARSLGAHLGGRPGPRLLKLLESRVPPRFLEGLGLERWGLLEDWNQGFEPRGGALK